MSPLLVAVVLLTLLLQPAAAASPFTESPAMFGNSPFESAYPDPDGMLDAICATCGISLDLCLCIHALTQPSRRPTFTVDDFLSHPEWPQDDDLPIELPDPMPEPLPYSTFDSDRQPLINETLRQLNDNATTVQPSTVQYHVQDTYLPGDRIAIAQAAASRRLAQRRHAPRPGGFPCLRCGKPFNRACDLNRHQKTHQLSNDRPHKCSYCAQGFLYPKDRARHEKTHEGTQTSNTTVYCNVHGCGNSDGFSRRDNLLRHHRKQHPGIPIPA